MKNTIKEHKNWKLLTMLHVKVNYLENVKKNMKESMVEKVLKLLKGYVSRGGARGVEEKKIKTRPNRYK